MINKILIRCLILLSSALPTLSLAADQWSEARQVVSVQVLGHGGFIIQLDTDADSQCTIADGSNAYLVYPQQNDITINGSKALLSTALVAFSTGNKLNIKYSLNAGYCWVRQILLSK